MMIITLDSSLVPFESSRLDSFERNSYFSVGFCSMFENKNSHWNSFICYFYEVFRLRFFVVCFGCEPIRRSGHVAADDRKNRKFVKCSAGENKGGSTIGSAVADDEKSREALDTGGEAGQTSAIQEALLPEPNWAGMSHNQRNKWRRRKSKKK